MRYIMHLDVPADLVPTIFEVLKDTGIVVKVEPHNEVKPTSRKHRYVNGKRNKGISGSDLLVQTLQSKPMDYVSLQKVFAGRGFAESSVSSNLSKLATDGLVGKKGDKYYYLKK